MAITRKRIDVANARTMTSDTKVLGATVGEWNSLFTGNFVQNLEADRKRGEILRLDEQLESIKRNIARVEREVVDSIAAAHLREASFDEGHARLVRLIVGGSKPTESDKPEGTKYFRMLRKVQKRPQLLKVAEKKPQRPKKVIRQPKTEKTGVNLFEAEISR